MKHNLILFCSQKTKKVIRIGFLANALTAIQDTTHARTSTTATENGMFRLVSFAMKAKPPARRQGQATAMVIG